MFDSLVRPAFVITLALSVVSGLLFVAAQLVAVIAGQGGWLLILNDTAKIPVIVVSSVCAVFGYLLTYSPTQAEVLCDETH